MNDRILTNILTVITAGALVALAFMLFAEDSSATPERIALDKPIVASFQQFAPSYIWNYTVVSPKRIHTMRLEAPGCFLTEAGTWSNWTPLNHIDLELWGGNSHLEWDYSIAYWEPERWYLNFHVLTLEARDSIEGVIYIDETPYPALVPDCKDQTIYLPITLNWEE